MATSQVITQSSCHVVMSSQSTTSQLVTHTHVSSHSQLVTSEHITKPFCCSCKFFICTPVR